MAEMREFGVYATAAKLTGAAITLLSLGWGLQVPSYMGVALFQEQFLATILGCALLAVYLMKRVNRATSFTPPWYDVVFGLTAAGVLFYTAVNWREFLVDFHKQTPEMVMLGVAAVALVLEALRRLTGWFLFSIVALFIGYALIGHLVPAPLTGRNLTLEALIVYLGFDTNAMLGVPVVVSATIVLPYIFFGQLLLKSGGGTFFTDLAKAAVGNTRGGAAKISVVASGLFGSISGSAVSNVATTGVITIPLMRKSGYQPVQAGAIEAVASTGGQLMPPIMGAAAFMMAELLEIPYADVVLAGLVPALLYYLAVFIQVDLIAAKEAITVPDVELPKLGPILREGWHMLAPFAVLIYALFFLNTEAEIAAVYASAAMVIGGFLRSYAGERLGVQSFLEAFWRTGHIMMELLVIVAAAGFVIGILSATGLSFALTFTLVQLAAGQLWILLLTGAVICIVLGMGMPTAPLYLLLALLVAPALQEAGVVSLSAHFFILYFGMMSMITPPIALAAFTAATITGASPERTGLAAVKLGWVAYLIPFLFVISPTFILSGATGAIVNDLASAIFGVLFVSIGMVGFFTRRLGALFRLLLALIGLFAMLPETMFYGVEFAGVTLKSLPVIGAVAVASGIMLLAWEYYTAQPERAAVKD